MRSGASGDDLQSDFVDMDHSFAMNELSRMLNAGRTNDSVHSRMARTGPFSSSHFYGSATNSRVRDFPRSSSDSGAVKASGNTEWNNASSGSGSSSRRRAAPRTFVNATQAQRTKRTNETSKTPKKVTDKRKPSNLARSPGGGHSVEADRLLALHLAEDFNGSAGVNQFLSENDRPVCESQNAACSVFGEFCVDSLCLLLSECFHVRS